MGAEEYHRERREVAGGSSTLPPTEPPTSTNKAIIIIPAVIVGVPILIVILCVAKNFCCKCCEDDDKVSKLAPKWQRKPKAPINPNLNVSADKPDQFADNVLAGIKEGEEYSDQNSANFQPRHNQEHQPQDWNFDYNDDLNNAPVDWYGEEGNSAYDGQENTTDTTDGCDDGDDYGDRHTHTGSDQTPNSDGRYHAGSDVPKSRKSRSQTKHDRY